MVLVEEMEGTPNILETVDPLGCRFGENRAGFYMVCPSALLSLKSQPTNVKYLLSTIAVFDKFE